ncbi:MAG: hypothetical protein PHV61_10770 [Limnochordia bacterium]|nr:hypothetical protein [Limnochordia bacterium]
MNRLVVISLLTGVILLFTSCIFGRSEEIRPLTITVIDSLTKEPVEGAVVYYKLDGYRQFSSLGLPLPATVLRVVMMEKTYTDENGVVIFPRRRIRFETFEHFFAEVVFINLEKAPPPEEDNPGEFFSCLPEGRFNPIDHLKGAFIGNHQSKGMELPVPDDDYTSIYNWDSFSKMEENVLVELERKE